MATSFATSKCRCSMGWVRDARHKLETVAHGDFEHAVMAAFLEARGRDNIVRLLVDRFGRKRREFGHVEGVSSCKAPSRVVDAGWGSESVSLFGWNCEAMACTNLPLMWSKTPFESFFSTRSWQAGEAVQR